MVECKKRVMSCKAKYIRHVGTAVLGIHILSIGIGMYGLKHKDGLKTVAERKEEKVINKKIYAQVKDVHIANTLAKSKYPKILTAIAKVESDCRPQVKGDSGKSFGMFQIQEQHWGKVGDSVEDQTASAEKIVTALYKKHGFPKCIERYNGKGRQARDYKKKVLLIMANL